MNAVDTGETGALGPSSSESVPPQPEAAQQRKRYEVVVGMDFSELSRRALEQALSLANDRAPAEVHVITVAEAHGLLLRLPGDGTSCEEQEARDRARTRVAEMVEAFQSRHGPLNLERVAVYAVTGDAARQITELARALDADLVVVGTHGRTGIERLVLGSVAETVLRRAECGVYVVKPRDFWHGSKVPDIQPSLRPGQPHMRHFEHRRAYHYVTPRSGRVFPVA